MTTSAAKRGEVGRETYWTRERVIEAIRRWVDLYGEPPRSADWNPSAAKWSASTWRIERYRAGDPETGEPWPSLNAAKKAFDGKISTAIEAAGFEPNKPGPKNRKNMRPDVAETQMTPDVRVVYDAAKAEVRDLRKKLDVRERELERARKARPVAAPRVRTKVRTKTKTKTITKVKPDRAAIAAAVKDVRTEMRAELNAVRLELASARRDSTRDASKLERAEATIHELRDERRELKADLDRALDRLAVSQRLLEAEKSKVKPEPEVQVVKLAAPEAVVVDEARRVAAEAEKTIEDAELRVAVAERKYLELAEAATGEARKLTAAELKELRGRGPAGEAVFTTAMRDLVKARRKGGRKEIKEALWKIASAAVRWRDRL